MTEIIYSTKSRIVFPQNGNSLPNAKRQEILNTLHGITTKQIEVIWQAISEQEQKKTEQRNKELYWNKEKILENLKENCVKVEEKVEMMWYKWKKVHINLPAVWKFKWFKFDYFVSNESVRKYDFKKGSELENKSYSMKEVWELLKAMNRYMKAMGVETDWEMNYEKDLRYWETDNYSCIAWDWLKQVVLLDDEYWLKDCDVAWYENLHVNLVCKFFYCNFQCCGAVCGEVNSASLFLKLSD